MTSVVGAAALVNVIVVPPGACSIKLKLLIPMNGALVKIASIVPPMIEFVADVPVVKNPGAPDSVFVLLRPIPVSAVRPVPA